MIILLACLSLGTNTLFPFDLLILILDRSVSLCQSTCEPYLKEPIECASLITASSIEVPPQGGNQSFFVQTASQLLPAITNADPLKCGPTAVSFACSNYFRPCPADG